MKEKYQSVGLKAGLEVHQQINTSKLFCSCPSLLRSDNPSFTVNRILNLVAGETGKVDAAAAHEVSKQRTFCYEGFDSTCLVELDEEPPHAINADALRVVLQIALLFNCKILPVTQVMRKTVLDGSNTSGFQRTALVAYDGYFDTSEGRVGIESVAIEEDSARKISDSDGLSVFRLDRLGIPLVEVTTKPDLKSASQIKEAALKIGEILRSCDVKRGLGTIRQDLNISIKGSKRVEIKGFQDPKMMIKTVEEEVLRQQACVNEGSCVHEVRRALPDGRSNFLRPMPGSARMYPETDVPLLYISRDLVNDVKKHLPKLASEHKSFLKKFGLNEELIALVLKDDRVDDFKTLTKVCDDYSLIAKSLTLFQKEIAKKANLDVSSVSEKLDLHVLEVVLESVGSKISSNDVKTVLTKIVQGESLDQAMHKADVDLSGEVKGIISGKPGLSQGAYMGLLMAKLKGKVAGNEIAAELKKQLS